MRQVVMLAGCGAVLCGLAFAQPGNRQERQPEGVDPAQEGVRAMATPVEREILARLERIERGLFRKDSTLPRSENDSLEQRLERMHVEVRAGPEGRIGNDGARVLDLDRELGALEDRVEREMERPVIELARRVADVEREIDRVAANRDGQRAVDDLRRTIGRLERQIASIERRIR